MKTCIKCKKEKPIIEFCKSFYRGHICKECARPYWKEHRKKTPYSPEYSRLYRLKHLKKLRKYQKEYQKLWRLKNPGKNTEYCRRWFQKNHPVKKVAGVRKPLTERSINLRKTERNQAIVCLANTGKHELQELAQIFGVSHQRITEIYKKYTGRLFRSSKKI